MAVSDTAPYIRKELVKVAESELHGRGLFARKKIARGTEIGRCTTRPAKKDGPHVLWLDDETGEAVKVTCALRYINHGGRPNVAYYDDLTVVALENIKPGEELLHHYGDEWE